MSKLPPSPTRHDDDDVGDDESVDLLAPTQDVDAMTSCDGLMSPDLLAATDDIHPMTSPDLFAATEAIDPMTPVKAKDQHHLHSSIHPLSARTHSLNARATRSPVWNSYLEDLRSEDVNLGELHYGKGCDVSFHDAVGGDNKGGVNVRDNCRVNVLRDDDR